MKREVIYLQIFFVILYHFPTLTLSQHTNDPRSREGTRLALDNSFAEKLKSDAVDNDKTFFGHLKTLILSNFDDEDNADSENEIERSLTSSLTSSLTDLLAKLGISTTTPSTTDHPEGEPRLIVVTLVAIVLKLVKFILLVLKGLIIGKKGAVIGKLIWVVRLLTRNTMMLIG